MQKDNILFIYLCTRKAHDLWESLVNNWPYIAVKSELTYTSKETLDSVESSGDAVVFISNIYHHSSEPGADGNPEHEMTGALLASLIKNKNPKAKVYLFSEYATDEKVFDGVFKRNTKTGQPSEELRKFLTELEKESFK